MELKRLKDFDKGKTLRELRCCDIGGCCCNGMCYHNVTKIGIGVRMMGIATMMWVAIMSVATRKSVATSNWC